MARVFYKERPRGSLSIDLTPQGDYFVEVVGPDFTRDAYIFLTKRDIENMVKACDVSLRKENV